MSVAVVVLFLTLGEVVCSFIAPPPFPKGVPFPREHIMEDDVLGYRPKPSVTCSATAMAGGQVTYSVTYATDEHGRRITPEPGSGSRERFALFFGGSMTFGQGVNQDETLPYCFSQCSPTYRSYNYGFCGYGPQAMLAKLQSGELEREVSEPKGLAVYTFVDHHIRRAIGSMFVHNCWGAKMPYYRVDAKGRLVRRGSFTTGRPLTHFMYWLLGKSAIGRCLRLDYPFRETEEHLQLVSLIVREAKREFDRRLGGGTFVALFYPGSSAGRVLSPGLRQAGVLCLDYGPFGKLRMEPFVIPGDGHPTPLGHRTVAQLLARDLKASVPGPKRDADGQEQNRPR